MKSLSSHTTSSLFCESVEEDTSAVVTIVEEASSAGIVVELEEPVVEDVTLLSVIEFLLESVELFKTADLVVLVVSTVFAVSLDLEGEIFSEGFTELLSKAAPPHWLF